MYCSRCGQKNPSNSRFCQRCGAPLLATPTRRPRSRPWLPLALGALAVAVCLVLLLAVALLLDEDHREIARSGETPPPAVTATPSSLARAPLAAETALAVDTPAPATPSPRPSLTATQTPTTAPALTLTLRPTAAAAPTRTPPAATAASTPTLSPTATPSPRPAASRAPSCRQAAQGLIGFRRQDRCDSRTGNGCGPVEIWVMNADGSGQARMCDSGDYQRALDRDRTAPDGTWQVTVGGRYTDIIRVYNNGRQEGVITNGAKDWDPVLSADGWWLAWVTNRNANDEIYIKTLDPADQNQRRLTINDWEWDKHPSWSPDGRKIAFYSNRANALNEATRQIWVMDIVNDQGTNLRNLSNHPNKVDTDPVWFKWGSIP